MKQSSSENKNTRRKALYWVAGALSVMMFWKYVPKKQKKAQTVKMLAEDGKLVEVDLKYLQGQRTKLKPDEFHSWVKRKK
jgi:hypothetical protein